MKILIIDSSYPMNTRNLRILSSLSKENNVKYVSWNRENLKVNDADKSNYILNSNVGYGNKIKKLINLNRFRKFISESIRDFNPEVIIASHWDNLFIASIYKKQNMKLVYENLDMPTHKNGIVHKLMKLVEYLGIKKTDSIIFASRFFLKEYEKIRTKKIVLENLPSKKASLMYNGDKILNKDINLKISYIGNIRYYEILSNLIDVSRKCEIYLQFYGDGPDGKLIKEKITNDNLISFYGRYDYNEIAKFYLETDLLWAAYPDKDYNVKYAISNKFFESLVFETPIIVSKNSYLGELVDQNGLGFTINPYNKNEIREIIEFVKNNKEELNIKIMNIRKFKENENIYWEDNEFKLKEVIQ